MLTKAATDRLTGRLDMCALLRRIVFAVGFFATCLLQIDVVQAADRWPDAYARQGIKLGITLADFKQKPYPHLDVEEGVTPVCSDEARKSDARYASVEISESDFQGAGAIKCGYYFTDPDLPPTLMDVGVNLLDELVPTKFFFLPDETGEFRLAQIETIPPKHLLPRLLPALEHAYGKAPEVVSTPMQNGFGAKFEFTRYFWSNASSKAEVQDPGGLEKMFALIHSLPELTAALEKAKANKAGEDAGKL